MGQNKVVIVCLYPSGADLPKKNDTIDRLLNWCTAWGLTNFEFMNCSDDVGEKYTIDFDKLVKCEEANKVIALGNVASDSLRKVNVEHFKMPHPSPRNRQLNDKQFEKTMIRKCYNYLQG